jgi:hypothetical protein
MSSENKNARREVEKKLDDWLTKHDARCMWQTWTQAKGKGHTVEGWLFTNGTLIVVMRFAGGMGWEVFIQGVPHTNDIFQTFEAVEKHLGLDPVKNV